MTWIDAQKQLPKDKKDVLVVVKSPSGNPHRYLEIMHFSCEDCEWHTAISWAPIDAVTHWMELPVMPEEQDGK